MISLCSNAVTKLLVNRIHTSKFFSIIANETSDIPNVEQLSLCIRYVDEDFIPQVFLGLYSVASTDSATIFATVCNALRQHTLDISNCRGQSYDGAANMRGNINGLQAKFRQVNPLAKYLYCSGHKMNLVVQEAFLFHHEGINALEVYCR